MQTFISLAAQYLFATSIAISIFIWARLEHRDKRSLLLLTAVSGVIAIVLIKLGGAIVMDPRPFAVGHYAPLFPHAPDNGFPSDHTVLAALLGFLVLLYSRKIGVLLLVLALVIGAARVAAGVHHPEDVIAGFVISLIAVATAFLICSRIGKTNLPTLFPIK